MKPARNEFCVPKRPSLLSDAELSDELAKAVNVLGNQPGVRRIWLFGSAARGNHLDWRSDLDFAVEGLPAEDLERAWAILDETLRLPVELVRFESANSVLRNLILREGRLLCER